MAFTITPVTGPTVWGNQNIKQVLIVADAATGVIATGFQAVTTIIGLAPKSLTTGAIKLRPNLDASGAVANGSIGCSGLAIGDEFWLTIAGR